MKISYRLAYYFTGFFDYLLPLHYLRLSLGYPLGSMRGVAIKKTNKPNKNILNSHFSAKLMTS